MKQQREDSKPPPPPGRHSGRRGTRVGLTFHQLHVVRREDTNAAVEVPAPPGLLVLRDEVDDVADLKFKQEHPSLKAGSVDIIGRSLDPYFKRHSVHE